jgi:hypothetical protein
MWEGNSEFVELRVMEHILSQALIYTLFLSVSAKIIVGRFCT